MPRITPVDHVTTSGATRQMLDAVQSRLGTTPNLMKTLAVAPAALKGYLDLNDTLATGSLDRRFRAQIAIAVAQANACDYCLAAHHTLGALAGLTPDEMTRREAALQFARSVVADRGQVSDAALAKVRAAGFDDMDIVEIVANVVLNIFTNYINHVAQTTIDFPRVDALASASV
jgi:AhpD family alkylhydroperoxidase